MSAQDTQVPNYYSEPGLNPNRDYANQHFGEHIDPFTGKLQQHYTDIFIPGNGGFDLRVQRSYTSVEDQTVDVSSPLGLGWTMHFGRVISVTANCEELLQATVRRAPALELPDGSRQLFALSLVSGAQLISTNRWRATCDGAAGYTVTSPEGTIYEMKRASTITLGVTAWLATKITDKNGNFMTITYIDGTQGAVVSGVTTNDGRQVTFSYTTAPNGTFRLNTVSTNTSPAQTYTYQYTNDPSGGSVNFFLTRVNRPSGDAWVYDYLSASGVTGRWSMRSVTYPQGGSITYSYAFVFFNATVQSTAIATKTTSDGAWNLAYTPSSGALGVPDVTTINAPAGQQYVYEHVGYNSIASGSVWSIGLLTRKTLRTNGATTQTETYTWDKQLLSTQDNNRPAIYFSSGTIKIDDDYNAPILVSKTIARDGTSYTTNFSSFDAHGNPGVIAETGNASPSRSTSRTYCVNTTKWMLHNPAVDTVLSNGGSIGTINRSYDATCTNMLSENRFGVTTSYAYFATGDVQTKTNARGFATSYSSYVRGIPQTEAQPNGVTINRVVNSAGNVVSETNGEGFATLYTFDALNRLTFINHPIGNDVSISWTSTTRTLNRGSFQHIQTVDGYGRTTQISAGPAGGTKIVKSLRYNAVGQKTFESAPGSGAASLAGMDYAYDVLDRPTSIVHRDTSNQNAGSRTFSYLAGNAVNITDERGNLTRYNYLSFGNPDERHLTGITPPAATGAATTIGRNVLGQITSVSQGTAGIGTGVITRSYGYDPHFYLASIADPETGTTTMGRDLVGNMTSRSVGASGLTTFVYDGQNRLTSVSYPNPARNISQSWNRNHKLVSATTAASTRTWTYDQNDNLTREDLSVAGNTFSLVYAYDGNDQLSQITYPTSSSETSPPKNIVSYSPDVFGRPTAAAPFVTGVTHHANGQIATISHSNGATTTMGQDGRLRPSGIQTSRATASYIDMAYGYDAANNVTTITDSANPNNVRTLTYDGIDRLASVNGSGISYDGAGNILQQNFGGALNYTYDGQNRLASTSGLRSYVFSYDAYGNVAGNGATTFQYDDASNLLCVNCALPSKVEYDYDAKGMRILTRKNGATTYSMYGANGMLMFEFAPSTNQFTQHVYLKGLRVATRVLMVPFATATSVVASASQIRPGQSVVLTANVSGQNPTGTVTFTDNNATIGTAPLVNGVATFTTAGLSFGLHNFRASYPGDTNNAASSTPTPAVVMAGTNSSTSLVASASQVPSAQTVVLTATVAGDAPTGTVTFFDNNVSIGTAAVSGGTATFTTAPLPIGVHRFTASYGGDVNNSSSATPMATVVTAGTMSSTSLTTSSSRIEPGQTVTLTAGVSGQTPSGTVNFFDNGTLIGGATIAGGTATFATSALAFGVHTFTASYGGDANNFPSTSSGAAVTVGNVEALINLINMFLLDDD